ncbi:hypothetical protein EVAR_20890_1 [Eumeta japonica]|uniref:Uncharacterized protein n=1 Tax=Eumeta variegata TaxID=151549 RepID=A0A4C1UVH3_EUMVA|nr:hypothetical protein EVAR_20890_1 [Eumeta japonica]
MTAVKAKCDIEVCRTARRRRRGRRAESDNDLNVAVCEIRLVEFCLSDETCLRAKLNKEPAITAVAPTPGPAAAEVVGTPRLLGKFIVNRYSMLPTFV